MKTLPHIYIPERHSSA